MDYIVQLAFVTLLWQTCGADRDPFDMFSDTASYKSDREITMPATSLTTDTSLSTPPTPQPLSAPKNVSTLEHYQELHRILTRILWRSLSVAENHSLTADERVRIQLTASLNMNDIRMLSAYCHSNRTLSKRVSPDSVNALFSRLFDSVVILSGATPDSQSIQWNYLLIGSSFIILFLVARWIGVRRLLLITVPSLFITAIVLQALYGKYNERLAEKMAHMSRYHEPPEQCKPAHLQSWSTWFRGFFRANPSHDECAQYYERVITEPWIATSLYEIFLELLFEPLVTLFRISGRACGQFYHQSSLYFPPFLAAPTMVLFLMLICWLVLGFFRSPKPSRPANQKRRPKALKQKTVPSLPESKKQQ